MNGLSWDVVAKEFASDGSWRDIYILNTDLNVWQRMLDGLRNSEYELVYKRAGEVTELPKLVDDAFPAPGMADRLLWIRFAGVVAACNFFTHGEIEFDIVPHEMRGQEQLDALLGFMQQLSTSTEREAILTPENFREEVIFCVRPRDAVIEYRAVDA